MLRQDPVKGKEESNHKQTVVVDELELNRAQLDALQNLHARKAGLVREHFRGREWFNADEHVLVLNIALSVNPDMSIDDVLNRMQQDTPLQLRAMMNGLDESDVKQLNPVQLKALIEFSAESVLRLIQQPDEFNLAKLLRASPWFDSEQHLVVLRQMVLKYGYPFQQVFDDLQNLNHSQLALLEHGMRHGVSVQDVSDRDWIQDEWQVSALLKLLQSKNRQHAFELCKSATEMWQIIAIDDHTDSDELHDILALINSHQMEAFNKLSSFGLRASDLHDANWFSSQYHALILEQLVVKKCNKIHADVRTLMMQDDLVTREAYAKIEADQKRQAVLDSIQAIAGTMPLQAQIMFYRKYEDKNRVIHLNEFQSRAIIEIKFPFLTPKDVERLDWMQSEERLQVFKYLLKDSRLINSPQSRQCYEKVCTMLGKWDDERFVRVLRHPAQPSVKEIAIYRLPEVDQLLDAYDAMIRQRRAQDGNGCNIM